MAQEPNDRMVVELTTTEAALVIAALRQFEPYWPGDAPAASRRELLAGIREAIEHVTETLRVGSASAP